MIEIKLTEAEISTLKEILRILQISDDKIRNFTVNLIAQVQQGQMQVIYQKLVQSVDKPLEQAEFGIKIDPEIIAIAQQASSKSGMQFNDLVQRAVEVYCNGCVGRYRKHKSDLSLVPTSELMLSDGQQHSGKVRELTRRAILAIEKYNNTCRSKDKKWAITQGAIFSLIGSKPERIKQEMNKHLDRIRAHNAKHGLTWVNNRKLNTTINEEIDIASLVPTGIEWVDSLQAKNTNFVSLAELES